MDWREPGDDFGRQLIYAREAVLAHLTDPWHAVEPFEPILEDLRYRPSEREERLLRVRLLGRELFTEIRAADGPVAMEVRHYCWHLQHLGDPNGSPSSSLLDILMVTVNRFAAYESHPALLCSICAEFRGDIPYQGSPGGRDHFRDWLNRRYNDDAE